ncbi:MAG: DUF3078 domain-containing protein [Bacteroidota bacterium]
MKNLFIAVFFLTAEILIGQETKTDTTYWKKSGFLGLNASQTSLSNWQGGGDNNVAINAILNVEAVYKKDKQEWTNKLDAQYGLIKPGDVKNFRKNIDQLFALSKYNISAFGKYWYYAAQADYRTQFAPGFNYDGDSIIGRATSDINSPGYIQLALGLDFKPTDYFSVTIAPAAGKITVVNRQHLADAGAFGVEKATYDDAGNMLTMGKKTRFEFGGRIVVKFKKEIVKNFTLDSYLDLFSNYGHNPQNIDVVFNNLFTLKINKYFSANFISQLAYDDDIIIKRDWDKDGKYDNKNDINGPRVQLLSTVALGFGYKF